MVSYGMISTQKEIIPESRMSNKMNMVFQSITYSFYFTSWDLFYIGVQLNGPGHGKLKKEK